ncbi:MAG: SigE family polymerase sigma factor [Jatrophihabitantaceae bacterium]|nr:SigE family polymerase sigma factor [Jatrophihabitantaceae bacterium]
MVDVDGLYAREWHALVRLAALLVDDVPSAEDVVQEAQRDALVSALGALPRRQKEVLVLRYWSQLSEAEIAAALGVSAGTVKTSASRGLAALQLRLEGRS